LYTVRVGFKVSEVRPNTLYETSVDEGVDRHLTTCMTDEYMRELVKSIPTAFDMTYCAQGENAPRHTCVKVTRHSVSHAKRTVGIDVVYTESCITPLDVFDIFFENVRNLMHKANAASQQAIASA